MKALRVIVFVLSFVLIYGWVFYRIILSYTQPGYDEIVNLNMNCKLLTHKHNEVNHMLNDAPLENAKKARWYLNQLIDELDSNQS